MQHCSINYYALYFLTRCHEIRYCINTYTCKTMITEKLNCLLLYYLQHYESPTETKSNGLYTEHRVIGDLSNLIVRYS